MLLRPIALWLECIKKKQKKINIQTDIKNCKKYLGTRNDTLKVRVTFSLFLMYHLFFGEYSSVNKIGITKGVSSGVFFLIKTSS